MYRVLTMPGRILLMCTGLVALYSLMSVRMPIHNLGIVLVMLYAVDFVVGFLVRPRVSVARYLPGAIREGASGYVRYRVTNPSKRAAWSVNLDSLPLPGELHLDRRRAWVGGIGPGETRNLEVELTGSRRGEYTMPAVRADTAFPFYLWRWGAIHGTPERVLVHPKFTPLRGFDLPVGRSHQPGGISMASNLADSMEFYGCREYRYGDNPRHIHWRSWARTGYPVTREFRQEYFPRVALVLDTHRPRKWHRVETNARDEVFEGAVSITAAVGEHLSRLDYVVDFFAAGREVYRFQTGRSLGYFEQLLDILACLRPQREEPFDKLRPAVVAEAAGMTGIVLILLSWNEERRRMLEDAAASTARVRTVLVNESGSAPSGFPEEGTVLSTAELPQVTQL